MEHTVHTAHLRCIEVYGLVKHRIIVEHHAHIDHTIGIKIERLVEVVGVVEHITCIPQPTVEGVGEVERAIELFSSLEHTAHILYGYYIEIERLVEYLSSAEHTGHILYLRGIGKVYGLVERSCIAEHIIHTTHF